MEEEGEIERIVLYLQMNYQKRITIDTLTREFHINRTTLTQRFSKVTGVSVMAYLINLRVRLAALMLRDTSLPVTEIMTRVGFNDMTYFGRVFRKHTGLTPSNYREKYCWM